MCRNAANICAREGIFQGGFMKTVKILFVLLFFAALCIGCNNGTTSGNRPIVNTGFADNTINLTQAEPDTICLTLKGAEWDSDMSGKSLRDYLSNLEDILEWNQIGGTLGLLRMGASTLTLENNNTVLKIEFFAGGMHLSGTIQLKDPVNGSALLFLTDIDPSAVSAWSVGTNNPVTLTF